MLRRLPHHRAVPSPPLPQPTTVAAIAAASLIPYLAVRLQRTAMLAPLASRSAPALYAFARPLICPALRVHLAFAQFTRPPTPIPGDQGVSSSGARRAPSQRGAAPRRPSCCLTSLFGYSGGGAWVATHENIAGDNERTITSYSLVYGRLLLIRRSSIKDHKVKPENIADDNIRTRSNMIVAFTDSLLAQALPQSSSARRR